MVQGHAIGRVEAAARAATSATLAERKIFPKPFVNHAVNSRGGRTAPTESILGERRARWAALRPLPESSIQFFKKVSWATTPFICRMRICPMRLRTNLPRRKWLRTNVRV